MIASKKQIVTICWVCKEGEARQVCGGCKNVRYCSRGCQRQDWTRHKPECHGRDKPQATERPLASSEARASFHQPSTTANKQQKIRMQRPDNSELASTTSTGRRRTTSLDTCASWPL
jgi:hypothetical protein